MSDKTKLIVKIIVKIIETRAAIVESDSLSRFGILTGDDWHSNDLNLAILSLEDLIKASQCKLKELKKLQSEAYRSSKELEVTK